MESLYKKLEDWQLCKDTTKDDIVRNVRSRITKIITELLNAPQVGQAFSHPSDRLHPDVILENGVVYSYEKDDAHNDESADWYEEVK